MGLRKASEPAGLRRVEPRDYIRNGDGLIEQLQDPDVSTRRWAARDLAEHPLAASVLCEHLHHEIDPSVREVIFTTLERIGGLTTVDGVLPLLRSEDANLRNSAIGLLSSLPDAVGPRIEALLTDHDADVRIFTVNLLGDLKHADVGRWLAQVLKNDAHINVVAAALEVLAEVGTHESLPILEKVRQRFADDAFIAFAADLAEQRIEAA